MAASVGHGMTARHYRGAWRGPWGDCRTLQRGASVGHGMTAGHYGLTAGKRGTSGYEPAGKSNPFATGLKAA